VIHQEPHASANGLVAYIKILFSAPIWPSSNLEQHIQCEVSPRGRYFFTFATELFDLSDKGIAPTRIPLGQLKNCINIQAFTTMADNKLRRTCLQGTINCRYVCLDFIFAPRHETISIQLWKALR